ncbi:LPS export ABC transporter permease LptG [Alphaproteobacteria bacterium HT1-32]|nr:LPS export ABC transporter permease LptG [Alphaproteobacteria bacterium HT1-32]|tara:strand:- start:33554 stop:34678 length:1125 start_codon:yes stop_codon:yes gene_type:complete
MASPSSRKLSAVLSVYIGWQFLFHVFSVLLILLGIIFLFDFIELMRRASSRPDVTIGLVAQMTLMKLPHLGMRIVPFAILFGGMACFWRLTRYHELIVARAAGVSVWQLILPPLIGAVAIGMLQTAVLNPLSSLMLSHYEQLENRFFRGISNALDISGSGFWLRQGSDLGQDVIHAKKVYQQGVDVELTDVTIYRFNTADEFTLRLDAKFAQLGDGFWYLQDVWTRDPTQDKRSVFLDEHFIDTDLTLGKIQDSFATPETMSFWSLPGFIEVLETAGFSALRHRLHLQSLLSTPLLLCAMVLIAAAFSLRLTLRTSAGFLVVGGVSAGFLLFVFSDITRALGLSESIPILLAAWSPAGVSSLLGLALLFHLEDG